MKVIYNGGFLPALAIDDSSESPSWGWLMAKNPLDGQWVTIANLSAQITAQTDDVIDAQIATLTAKLAECERERDAALTEVKRLNDWADGMTDIALRERATGDAYQKELRAKLAETQTQLIRANLEVFRYKEYLADHVHRLNVWIAETREKLGK